MMRAYSVELGALIRFASQTLVRAHPSAERHVLHSAPDYQEPVPIQHAVQRPQEQELQLLLDRYP